MGETGATLKPEVAAALVNYVARLGKLVALCARYVDRDPEIFLWNSRRVLEVVCHILYTVKDDKVSRDKGDAGDMLKRIQGLNDSEVISSDLRNGMDLIRKQSNLGVHVRGPEKEDYPFAIKQIREQLPDLLDWLFRDSIAGDHIARPDSLNGDLEAIRRGRPEQPTEPTARTQPVVVPLPPPPVANSRIPAVALGVLLGAGLLAGWRFVLGGTPEPIPMATASLAPAALQVEVAPSATPAATPLTCTDGMVRIDGVRLRLGPPEGGRAGWPSAARSILDEVEVASFCIDKTARSWVQFADWPESRGIDKAGCSWRNQDRGKPVVCLTRSEAAAYCAAQGARLPTILEWEALQRSPESGAAPSVVREWVADEFPPVALGFAEDVAQAGRYGLFRQKLSKDVDGEGRPLNSWNRQELDNRWSNLGFRCAADPS